ncbi:SpoIIE family protein phosphatase [uncultured Aquitalea sp.]|uniref:PP2C family protein-serine/threonine phosphatase n=1 Tax=uncultured Aquitalea sp. TaxID=540272 RepID=UPI0025F27408|nr:SpoIIE family protein phosphatase [uncultured Aquitalea sp.]
MTRQLKILVAEDSKISRLLMGEFIKRLGHEAVMAENGAQALELCRIDPPDAIFMDVAMPVMDGFAATRAIRQLMGEHWIPIIYLTSVSDREQLLRGLETGGDDYLIKPVDMELLTAKLNVLLRIADMQQRIAADAERLEAYYRANEQEQAFARMILDRFTRRADHTPPNIQQWQLPAMNFSGDTICIRRSKAGLDRLMLADSTGHGLTAAICGLPAVDTFFAMTDRQLPMQDVIRTINRKLHGILPVGRFVAAALIEVDYQQRRIAVWNGGIPCALYVNQQGVLEREFVSRCPPLGILPDEAFDASLDLYQWQDAGSVIVCSDGITEARNPAGQAFGNDGVVRAAQGARTRDIQGAITHAVSAHLGRVETQDDISLVVVRCP